MEYFWGALAYLEAGVPVAFGCFAAACERLGIVNGQYYTEHMHIDAFHSKELLTALREVEAVDGVDYAKVWIGVLLGNELMAEAFEAATSRAIHEVS